MKLATYKDGSRDGQLVVTQRFQMTEDRMNDDIDGPAGDGLRGDDMPVALDALPVRLQPKDRANAPCGRQTALGPPRRPKRQADTLAVRLGHERLPFTLLAPKRQGRLVRVGGER